MKDEAGQKLAYFYFEQEPGRRTVAKASSNLRTIDPHDKEENKRLLKRARKWINDASVIYILGYAFDENNNRRIGLNSSMMSAKDKAVMFTNLGDLNTVNKRASKAMFGSQQMFLDRAIVGGPTTSYYEKSVRNVYEALEKDFGTLESELIAGAKI